MPVHEGTPAASAAMMHPAIRMPPIGWSRTQPLRDDLEIGRHAFSCSSMHGPGCGPCRTSASSQVGGAPWRSQGSPAAPRKYPAGAGTQPAVAPTTGSAMKPITRSSQAREFRFQLGGQPINVRRFAFVMVLEA